MLSPAPLLLLFGLAAGPLGTGPSADGLDDFVERVREGDPERGLAVLEDLQPAATERLVAVLARIEPLAEESFLSFQERELLLGVVAGDDRFIGMYTYPSTGSSMVSA